MSDLSRCPFCQTQLQPTSRYCPGCGRLVGSGDALPEDVLLPGKRVNIGDTLNVHELLGVVEAGVAWWRQKLQSTDTQTREAAARAIEDLSAIFKSLSAQLSQGRETIRITTRLPAERIYPLACPYCGHGNRAGAKFCQRCGGQLTDAALGGGGMRPGPALRYLVAARSDIGMVRATNQDAWVSLPLSGGHLCVVADGMGGARAGEVASKLASEVVRDQIKAAWPGQQPQSDQAWLELIRRAAVAANRQVYQQARGEAQYAGMGTTLTVALLIGEKAFIGQVGDSRAYLLNAAGISADGVLAAQLTTDHSLVARLVDIGQITPDQARNHRQKNLLYRSVGTDPNVEVDTAVHHIRAGDMLLLCSDGLTNHVEDPELTAIVLGAASPEAACETLVRLAKERGGRDNITAMVVRIEEAR